MYTHIDRNDREAVTWLQITLSKLLGEEKAPRLRIGVYDTVTWKIVELFQQEHGLPVTGEADEATLRRIQEALGQT